MTGYFIPKRSSAHRVACVALYRALISQSSRVHVPDERWRGPINPIKHLIRKQFRRNQHEQSPRLVVAALKAGYEAEELLNRAGNGNQVANAKVLSILENIQSKGDAERARQARNPPSPKTPQQIPKPYPGAKPVVETRPRPLSELSGRRRLPVLVTAHGMPLLRFKKPQSPYLSRLIRDRLSQKQGAADHLEKIESTLGLAKDEDKWDAQIGQQQDTPWTKEVTTWKGNVRSKINRIDQKATVAAKWMLDVVDQEKELFQQERKDRKAERNKKWKERNQEKSRSLHLEHPEDP